MQYRIKKYYEMRNSLTKSALIKVQKHFRIVNLLHETPFPNIATVFNILLKYS